MSNNTLPVGSVVLYEDIKFMVIGIGFSDEDNKLVKKYTVVPLPFGYVNSETTRVINASDVELVKEGYKAVMADAFVNYIDSMTDLAEKTDSKTLLDEMDKVYEQMKEKL